MRGVSLQAKTNMQRVALCLLALLMCSVECGRPAVLPSTIPDPLAYYALDDGSGFELRDTVSGADSGRVLYDANHQSTTYTEPNWTDDERFNKTIQCGAKNGAATMPLRTYHHDRNGRARRQRGGGRRCENRLCPPLPGRDLARCVRDDHGHGVAGRVQALQRRATKAP